MIKLVILSLLTTFALSNSFAGNYKKVRGKKLEAVQAEDDLLHAWDRAVINSKNANQYLLVNNGRLVEVNSAEDLLHAWDFAIVQHKNSKEFLKIKVVNKEVGKIVERNVDPRSIKLRK